MTGLIDHQQRVTLAPLTPTEPLRTGQVVLVKVRGTWLLHKIKRASSGRLLISNAKGRENGWVAPTAVAGVLQTVHDD